jgi:hypothetical protein
MSNYVVFEIDTTLYAGRKGKYDFPIFDTVAAAKSHITRLIKSGKYTRDQITFAPRDHFQRQLEKRVTKRNLLSGKEFTQPINTPLACDPSSETYWSM